MVIKLDDYILDNGNLIYKGKCIVLNNNIAKIDFKFSDKLSKITLNNGLAFEIDTPKAFIIAKYHNIISHIKYLNISYEANIVFKIGVSMIQLKLSEVYAISRNRHIKTNLYTLKSTDNCNFTMTCTDDGYMVFNADIPIECSLVLKIGMFSQSIDICRSHKVDSFKNYVYKNLNIETGGSYLFSNNRKYLSYIDIDDILTDKFVRGVIIYDD